MPNQRLAILSLACAPLAFAACGGGEITLEVYTQAGDEVQPVADLPVEFLPYDRDSVFAALASQASEPEPQISADLQQAFDSVQVLQEAWRTAEQEWNDLREEMRQLQQRLQGMDRRSREYVQGFERFGQLERRERQLNQSRTRAFNTFTGLQQATQTRLDSLRAVIESWEDIAFQEFPTIQSELLEGLGREIVSDTTNAAGSVTRGLPGGGWWVHARVAIPTGELYWNVPFQTGAVDTLRLTPENAQRRLVF